MEDHARADLEGVGEAVGRHAPALGDVGLELGIIVGIDLEQQRVVRRQHVHGGIGRDRVAVGARRLGRDGKSERAPALRRLGARHTGEARDKTNNELRQRAHALLGSLWTDFPR